MNNLTLSDATENVLKYLCSIRQLSPQCLGDLHRYIKVLKVKKGDIILKVGEINDKLFFIYSGGAHCFYYVGEKEVSSWFFFERELVVAIKSFYDQVASKEGIVALEDCELLYIPYDKYELLCDTHHSFEGVARRLLQKYLVIFSEHAQFLRTHTAKQRIRLIKEKMPHLFYRVPLTALASWLGMRYETLNRNK